MPTHATCPLCGTRRARRTCPALAQEICPVCCATKRLVEIRCPASCPYLASAKAHPAAVVQRRHERDLAFFLPLTSSLSEQQYRLLLFFQALVVRHRPTASPPLRDEDVAAAAEAMASTLETSMKGIVYEHQAASLPAQQLTTVLRRGLAEAAGDTAGERRVERDAAAALRQLEAAARTAASALPGDDPPVYLNLVDRLMRASSDAAPDAPAEDASAGSGLIITG
jgi:hypothetical protein